MVKVGFARQKTAQRARCAAVAIGCLLAALPVGAQQYKKLTGEYRIAGQTVIDPPPHEPTDTHMYFALDGGAARDLYNAMHVAARADECGEPGALLKSIGAMQCTRAANGKTYQCGFAIDIAKQNISGASAC